MAFGGHFTLRDNIAMQQWEYLTTYISGELEFPESVDRGEMLRWSSRSISQQLNALAQQGWEVIDQHWLSDIEVMVTFRREYYSETKGER